MEGREGTVKEERVVIGHLEAEMKTKIKMKMWVLAKTRAMKISTNSMIKTLESREVKAEDMEKVQEEEAFVVPVSIVMKKVIDSLNVLNDKEGYIGELRVKLGLLMWMRMHTHHI